jgi:hypothetical protein
LISAESSLVLRLMASRSASCTPLPLIFIGILLCLLDVVGKKIIKNGGGENIHTNRMQIAYLTSHYKFL